jgi:hypothetical protein
MMWKAADSSPFWDSNPDLSFVQPIASRYAEYTIMYM